MKKLRTAVESLLFVYGEPMEIKRIADILKVEENAIDEALKELESGYLAENRGIKTGFQRSAGPIGDQAGIFRILEEFIKEEFKENLTPASLETLSLVAYLGPLSRVQIDYHRGVNSSFILRNLLIRGLIERFPDPQKSNVYLYQPSFDLLKYLGISKIEELPEYEKFKTII